MPRSRLSTSMGVRVLDVASTKTSAVPSAPTSTTEMPMLMCRLAITTQSTARTTPAHDVARRSSRCVGRAGRRAHRRRGRRRSHGTCSASIAEATRTGLRVCEAT